MSKRQLRFDPNTRAVQKSTVTAVPTGSCLVVDTILTTSPSDAAAYIRRGRLVAFPTETVYGLGADVYQPDAVASIFEAKGRPSDNPLIVHVADRAGARALTANWPGAAQALTERFWPGPLTVILQKSETVPSVVTAGLSTVGLRWPSHPVTQVFLKECDTPVAAPSANRSGRPSPTTWKAVQADLGGRVSCILMGGRTEAGVESTVVDCTTDPPTVLRPGAVAVEALREAIGRVAIGGAGDTEVSRSPGTKHQHYAPAAQVQLVSSPKEARSDVSGGYIGLDAPDDTDRFVAFHVADTPDDYAHHLFHFFRRCDEVGASIIFAQTVPERGIGRALNDRLRRAAAR